MTTREIIRDAAALGYLSACQAVGVSIDVTHDGAVSQNLAALMLLLDKQRDSTIAESGIAERRRFLLPRQANFGGALRPGDTITYPSGGAATYTVTSVETDAYEAVYDVRAAKAASPLTA